MLARHSGTVRFRLICAFETAVIVSFATPKVLTVPYHITGGVPAMSNKRFFLKKKNGACSAWFWPETAF